MVQKAIDFATKVHEGQYRKGTDRPYIVHPMEVGKIVSTMTQDEEIISAAILHDTIEDCEGVDANVLKEMRLSFLHLLLPDVLQVHLQDVLLSL